MKTYTRRDEARRRLRDSIVRVGDEPVYVLQVDNTQEPRRHPNPGDQLPNGREYLYVEDFAERTYLPEMYDRVRELGQEVDVDGGYDYLIDVAVENNRRYRAEMEQGLGADEDMGDNPSGLRVSYVPCDCQNRTARTAPLEALNLKPLKLGMVNGPQAASYAKRCPRRRNYSQGITEGNTSLTALLDTGPAAVSVSALGITRHCPELLRTLKGQYPTLREALSEMAGDPEVISRAFSRDFAVALDRSLGLAYLYYRDKRVGHSEDGHRFKLSPSFEYLKEGLIKKGVPLYATA